jgi:hypothetical protein
MGQRLRELVLREYVWQRAAESYLRVFRRVIDIRQEGVPCAS